MFLRVISLIKFNQKEQNDFSVEHKTCLWHKSQMSEILKEVSRTGKTLTVSTGMESAREPGFFAYENLKAQGSRTSVLSTAALKRQPHTLFVHLFVCLLACHGSDDS